jgi:putative tryptophan/tyrosine transport system substrate-binding protein
MNRRRFLCGLTLGTLVASLGAIAQQAGQVYRVGRLSGSTTPEALEAFRQGLREFGWTVGQNLVLEVRDADGDPKRLLPLAKELVATKPDVIVAAGVDAITAVREVTTSIPIVMSIGPSNAVERGLIASLSRPGGKVTGLIALLPELGGKRVQLLKEFAPRTRTLAVIFRPTGDDGELKHAEAAGQALGLTIRRVPPNAASDLDGAIPSLTKTSVDALYVQANATVLDPLRSRIARFAISEGLPTIGALPRHAEAGFLLSYGPSTVAWTRRSAYFVDRILRGSLPEELPVEQPTTFELAVNLKTAKALRLTIPPSLLLRADQVIE